MKTIYYNEKGQVDKLTTWINNSKWSWIIPVLCVLLGAFIEGI